MMEMNVGLEMEMEMEMGMGMQKLVCERSGSCNDAEDGGGRDVRRFSLLATFRSYHLCLGGMCAKPTTLFSSCFLMIFLLL